MSRYCVLSGNRPMKKLHITNVYKSFSDMNDQGILNTITLNYNA